MAALLPPPLEIDPPLLNTANPWATDLADLTKLYACPHTGAVTTRTSLLDGFRHNPSVHQYAFFDAATHDPAATAAPTSTTTNSASLNTLGYSPLTLDQYLGFIQQIAAAAHTASGDAETGGKPPKGFLVSVTGRPDDVAACYKRIAATQTALPDPRRVPLAMEVNLSCPNIPGAPPPAYDSTALLSYLTAIQGAIAETIEATGVQIPVGFKTPPYTHAGQFDVLFGALKASAPASSGGVCPLSFLTATNTLGSCLVMTDSETGAVPALAGGGIGGMAGAPLHPIALGNVVTLRQRLDAGPAALGHIRVIGAGGVSDAAGFGRMKSVGAYAVGVGTGLGIHGVGVFGKILP
ncbi:dihydroorotate dehydrogenase [Sporothrix curviconia]|uniref:Dihydroorotate dehydrogenase (fumarate) n=1 Tax=Sporothrix curviconia TaxID=1260050 RepID=A0ABP0C4D7_9PEZI